MHAERLIAEGHNLDAMCAANDLSLDFNACLKQSLLNLDYFVQNRKPGATKLLNVLQGRNEPESKAWYEAVKGYGFEGWAFAGAHQNSFSLLLNRLHDMRNDGLLQSAKWIHILGISTPSIAYLFNALQRCVTKINPDLQITFDTAGPFISAAKFQALVTHRLDKTGWTFSTVSMPKEGSPSDARSLNELAWEIAQRRPKAKRGSKAIQDGQTLYAIPVSTTVGARVAVNEICVGSNGSSDLDIDKHHDPHEPQRRSLSACVQAGEQDFRQSQRVRNGHSRLAQRAAFRNRRHLGRSAIEDQGLGAISRHTGSRLARFPIRIFCKKALER
jgi:hypothetical protein